MAENNDQLIVRLGDAVVEIIELDLPVTTIGRSSDNTLTLQHRLVSRRHAEVRREGDATVIVDLGSANGILVNGERLQPHQIRPLNPGMMLQIGPFALVYHVRTEAELTAAHLPDELTVTEVRADLHIQIDPRQRQQQVNEIVDSQYFRHLRDETKRLRTHAAHPPKSDPE